MNRKPPADKHTINEGAQQEFSKLMPLLKEHITGEAVTELAKNMNVSVSSIYNWIGGKIPDIHKCKSLIEFGTKILKEKDII